MSDAGGVEKNRAERGFALVTGASSGIGADLARELAARGWPLILVARRVDRLTALQDEIVASHGVAVQVLGADLAAPGAGRRLFDEVAARSWRVEILVNNAGHGLQGRFTDLDEAAVDAMFQLNIHALTQLTMAFVRPMVVRGRGRVLNVASAAAFLPSPYVSAYAATKAYVSSFSEAIAYELERSGVSVTTLYPGITTTEFNAVAGVRTPPLMDASILPPDIVARVGIDAMFRGRRAAIPGWINTGNALASKLLPRRWLAAIAGWLLARANGWA